MRNLIPHFVQEEYKKKNYEGTFEALTMFVDVSGFTPMTQALMEKGKRGAEILAAVMNGLFDMLVDAVYERAGFVSVFAGDAFTAIFPFGNENIPDDMVILHVFACIDKIQSIFLRHGIQTTPFGQFALQFKVGISKGTVNWGIVGRTEKTYFFRGEAIDGCAVAEHHAEKGDIIFDERVAQTLRSVPHIAGSAGNISVVQKGYYRLHEIPKAAVQKLKRPKFPRRKALSKKVVTRFLPDALIDFTEIGEFRNVAPIFISFEGISTVQELDDWAFVLLENIKTFGGYFNHLDFGDKGSVVLCGFGAPVAYENTIERALDFILAVKEDLQGFENLAGLKFRAGITYGTAYAGIAGGEKRCVYTFYGEVVNLAARFMMQAAWEEILVSEAVCNKAEQFIFEHKGDFPYKGFTEPVPTYTLIGQKPVVRRKVFTEQMIGRRAELQQLQDFAAPIFAGKFSGIAYIYGEAGIGKSRLAYALQEELQAQHTINWCNCPADQILRQPFNPFKTFFMRYFEQFSENTEAENKARFEEKYEALIEALNPHPGSPPKGEGDSSPLLVGEGSGVRSELIRTKSIIGAQLGLFWPESLWEQLDAKGKYENTLSAIKNFFLAQSLLAPVVIELEDGHWIDSDSLVLLNVLTRNIADYPIFFLSTLRYNDDGAKTIFQLEGVREFSIDLNYLSAEDVKHQAEAELEGSISNQLHNVLLEKTNGNPFFVQQLARYFVEQESITLKDDTWHLTSDALELPETVNAVLVARIDRLAEEVKDVVKTAAVIGREFDIVLLSTILKKDVLSQVQIVRKAQIWEELQELLYIFKHALLRDAAYQMQLKSRLCELHQLVAETMEALYATRSEKRYADLAFHYEKAEIGDKAIEYLGKAGDQAKAQYHNQQGIELYDRLLVQLQNVFGYAEVEIDTLLKKAEICELTGDWKACQQASEEALELAEQIDDKRRIGEANLLLGIIFWRAEQYDKAMTYFGQALELFEAAKVRAGIGRVYKNMGRVYWRKGDDNAAMACYEKALNIYEELEDLLSIAITTNNIGILYTELKVNYDAAMTWYQKSLQISEELGEMLNRSSVLNNTGECYRLQGNYDAAMAHYEKALELYEELGDKLGIAIALANLGLVYKAKDDCDTAIDYYDRAIPIMRDLESKYFLCSCLIDKADTLFLLQRYEEAQTLNAEGLQIVEEIGDEEYIFKGKVLSVRIAFALGNEDAQRRFDEMLQQTENDTEIATLHYELWKMTRGEEHRQAALKLYQTLYATTPNIEYKTRMEEMENYKD